MVFKVVLFIGNVSGSYFVKTRLGLRPSMYFTRRYLCCINVSGVFDGPSTFK
jgi:hypothetical protein